MKKNKKGPILFACGFVVTLFGLLFSRFVFGPSVLMATDPVVGAANKTAAEVWIETVANWNSGVLLGVSQGSSTQIASLLQVVLSGILWNNLIYGLACLAASMVFLVGFGKRLGPWAALCGALTAFWLGSNFTLIYAGHGLKPYVVLFFVCSVLSAGVPSWRGGVLWGGFTGLMFAQQPDVALFFALFAGTHLIFRLWIRDGFKPRIWLKVLAPAAVVAFLFAGGPLLSGYKLNVKDAAQVQTETPQEKWDYITQWSFPPDELISFIAPGYHGWRTGEPEGPYWGRTGQSAGWDQTRQGYMNFMMESAYIGLIPVVFALFALFSCRRSPHRAEILFWGVAAMVALLLAFGKYTPLYSLFYKLPVVNNIRNPNKFLQVFQVALAILTAYGFDTLFSQRSERLKVESLKGDGRKSIKADLPSDLCALTSEVRRFFWFTAAIFGLLTLWALSVSMNRTAGVAAFAALGWPAEAAQTIVANQSKALWHAAFMSAIAAFVFSVFSFPKLGKLLRFKNWLPAGLILIVAADAVKLSKHYVKEMPRSYIEANPLTDFLKKNLGTERVALLSQQGLYGIWTMYLLPYNRIPAFNIGDMPRMAMAYKTFLEAGQRDPFNMWRFSAVKYLLGPSAVERQLAGHVKKVFSYDVVSDQSGGFKIVSAMTGQHAVFELLNSYPRYAVTASIAPTPDEAALASVVRSPRPRTGTVEVLSYRPGRVLLRVLAETAAMLRIAEKWDVDWKAVVDGQPATVQRVDYICQGVAVPAGEHRVELRYAPSRIFFYLQCAGYLILAGGASIEWVRRKRNGHGSD